MFSEVHENQKPVFSVIKSTITKLHSQPLITLTKFAVKNKLHWENVRTLYNIKAMEDAQNFLGVQDDTCDRQLCHQWY